MCSSHATPAMWVSQNHTESFYTMQSLYVFVALPSHLLLWFRGSHRTQQLPLPFRSFQNRWWGRSLKSHSTNKWIRAISCHKKRFLQATKCTTKIHQHSSTLIYYDSNYDYHHCPIQTQPSKTTRQGSARNFMLLVMRYAHFRETLVADSVVHGTAVGRISIL